MSTRPKNAAQFDAPKNADKTLQNAAQCAYNTAPAPPKSGLKQEAHRSLRVDQTKETNETEDFKKNSEWPTQAAQDESYKAKKSPLATSEKLTQAPWKKDFWASMVDEVADEVGLGLYHMLRSSTWLERMDDNIAIVATDSEFSAALFARKAAKPLAKALTEALGQPTRVRFIQGNVRVLVLNQPGQELGNDEPPHAGEYATGEEAELAHLHALYGDIMGIVDNHPLLLKIQKPPEKGGWDVWPQVLTKRCKKYGVMAVLNAVRFVANRPSARDRRGFLIHVIDSGQFGQPLKVSAPTLGRVAP